MRYLHTMLRVRDLEQSLEFFCGKLGFVETRRMENAAGRFTLVYLAAAYDESRCREEKSPEVELTWNWDSEEYTGGRNFGHLAYEVDDIHALCERLMTQGVVILRPPRDGRMAFIRTPDDISIEFLQKGAALPPQQWRVPAIAAAEEAELWAVAGERERCVARARVCATCILVGSIGYGVFGVVEQMQRKGWG